MASCDSVAHYAILTELESGGSVLRLENSLEEIICKHNLGGKYTKGERVVVLVGVNDGQIRQILPSNHVIAGLGAVVFVNENFGWLICFDTTKKVFFVRKNLIPQIPPGVHHNKFISPGQRFRYEAISEQPGQSESDIPLLAVRVYLNESPVVSVTNNIPFELGTASESHLQSRPTSTTPRLSSTPLIPRDTDDNGALVFPNIEALPVIVNNESLLAENGVNNEVDTDHSGNDSNVNEDENQYLSNSAAITEQVVMQPTDPKIERGLAEVEVVYIHYGVDKPSPATSAIGVPEKELITPSDVSDESTTRSNRKRFRSSPTPEIEETKTIRKSERLRNTPKKVEVIIKKETLEPEPKRKRGRPRRTPEREITKSEEKSGRGRPKKQTPVSVENELKNNASAGFVVGQTVKALHMGDWYNAQILEVRPKRNHTTECYVHYMGWNKRWDEWVPGKSRLKYNEEIGSKEPKLEPKRTSTSTPAITKEEIETPTRTTISDLSAINRHCCNMCKRAVPHDSITAHSWSHMDVRPFSCSNCGYSVQWPQQTELKKKHIPKKCPDAHIVDHRLENRTNYQEIRGQCFPTVPQRRYPRISGRLYATPKSGEGASGSVTTRSTGRSLDTRSGKIERSLRVVKTTEKLNKTSSPQKLAPARKSTGRYTKVKSSNRASPRASQTPQRTNSDGPETPLNSSIDSQSSSLPSTVFQCAVCQGDRKVAYYSVRSHAWAHVGKPLVCSVCHIRGFYQDMNMLNEHVTNVHNGDATVEDNREAWRPRVKTMLQLCFPTLKIHR